MLDDAVSISASGYRQLYRRSPACSPGSDQSGCYVTLRITLRYVTLRVTLADGGSLRLGVHAPSCDGLTGRRSATAHRCPGRPRTARCRLMHYSPSEDPSSAEPSFTSPTPVERSLQAPPPARPAIRAIHELTEPLGERTFGEQFGKRSGSTITSLRYADYA